MKTGKIVMVALLHSSVDVITNSSSELFTAFNDSKETLKGLIKDVYPKYLKEYEKLKGIEELTAGELEEYIMYSYEVWSNYDQETFNYVIPGFTYDEMWETKNLWEHKYIQLKDYFVENNRERIMDGIDPERKMFFLFSKNENPNWDMQEKLMSFMTRYHLG